MPRFNHLLPPGHPSLKKPFQKPPRQPLWKMVAPPTSMVANVAHLVFLLIFFTPEPLPPAIFGRLGVACSLLVHSSQNPGVAQNVADALAQPERHGAHTDAE